MNYSEKINRAIEIMQKMEPVALRLHPDGFHLAFSGGKDSQVLYHIAKESGVKFKAHMQVTTIDPPELLSFIRNNYPDVVFHLPQINFYDLIKKEKMLPLPQMRFCCKYFKERGGEGTVTLIGIRADESNRRAKRNEIEVSSKKYSNSLDQFNIDKESVISCIHGNDKIIVSPIFHLLDNEIWHYLRINNIPYCKLYDLGRKRIGCFYCPMSTKKSKVRDRIEYPGVEKKIKQSIQFLIDNHNFFDNYNATADEIFDWWISGKSTKTFFFNRRYQLEFTFNE